MSERDGGGEFDPFPLTPLGLIMGSMNVILRFEPGEPDRLSPIERAATNSYVYRTGRSGDVVGDGDDDAAASPQGASDRRPRWTSLMAAASIAALAIGVLALGVNDGDGPDLSGTEIKTEAVAPR